MIENCEIDDPVSCGTCSKERGVGVFQLWHDCEFPARHFVKAPKPCCCDKMPATGELQRFISLVCVHLALC